MPRKMRWAQLRRKTDSGETRDKVAHPDPAAAPLGTDEEAGGARTSEEEIAKSAERQAGEDDPDRHDPGQDDPGQDSSHQHSRPSRERE